MGYTDHSEKIPCHLLPSFQMHNYLFNRNIVDDQYCCSNNPPEYKFDNTNDETTFDFENHDSTSGLSIFKKSPELPTVSVPLKVSIEFTRTPVKHNHFYNEYKPGSIISGCVTIQNERPNAISFDMIYISLEGEISLPNTSITCNSRYFSHTFLKMYDLNILKEQLTVETSGKRSKNIVLLGFDKSKQILPGATHILFFEFELPHYVLDCLCKDQCNQHLKLPPSLGIRSKFFGESFDRTNDISKIQFKREKNDVNDLSCPYQSVTYSINVLITSKQSSGETAILKNVLRYFNVETSTEYRKKSQASVISTPTTKQIDLIKKLTIEHLKESSENLLLNSNAGKSSQLLQNLNFTDKPIEKNPCQKFILNKNIINFKGSMWSSIAGEMAIEVKKNKFGSIKAFRSKVFTNSLNTDLPPAYDEINTVSLALTFDAEKKSKNCKLPSSIEIGFMLRAINLYSESPIPFVVDEDFLLNDGLSKKNVQKIKSQFKCYLTELRKKVCMGNDQDDQTLLRVVNSMSKLCVWQYFIDDYYRAQKFDLKNKWAFDPSTELYKCNLDVPMHVDVEKLYRSSNYHLVPSFQSCYMSRFYGIDLDIKVNKGLQEVKVKYPVRIL